MNNARAVSIVANGDSFHNYFESAPEIWGMNHTALLLRERGQRCNRMFWMDDLEYDKDMRAYAWDDLVVKYPYKHDMPIMSSFVPAEAPHIWNYPIKDVVRVFGTDYLNNTTAYALAMVALRGKWEFDEVHLHGVDYALREPLPTDAVNKWDDVVNRSNHRACVHFWLGIIHHLGIKIKVNPASLTMDAMHRHVRGFNLRGYRPDYIKLLETTDVTRMEQWQNGQPERPKRQFDTAS